MPRMTSRLWRSCFPWIEEISSGIPLDGPPHDRGETRDRHPEVQGKEKGILQKPICVWPDSFV